ncbi:hypothetical protein UCREL1_4742 [Eutypa lata UCREL1]|uniref:Uncharacterized protein n=1 Tax=Eutypa lata (strain UCR-EL1) TaxID=1287681 RepID=M7TNH0_EUTLA|nr:hypothetical protein UCREL1_4742 [Eutypa lata UCREL1]
MPQILKIWNKEGEKMNCMVEGASTGNNEITQSQASETMARFLRASNPGLGVIRCRCCQRGFPPTQTYARSGFYNCNLGAQKLELKFFARCRSYISNGRW